MEDNENIKYGKEKRLEYEKRFNFSNNGSWNGK